MDSEKLYISLRCPCHNRPCDLDDDKEKLAQFEVELFPTTISVPAHHAHQLVDWLNEQSAIADDYCTHCGRSNSDDRDWYDAYKELSQRVRAALEQYRQEKAKLRLTGPSETTMPSGGSRPNSGRKKSASPMQVIALRVDQRTLDNLLVLTQDMSCDRSEVIRQAVESLADFYRMERSDRA